MTVHGSAATDEEEALERIRSGDEIAFRALVSRYHGAMMCIARRHVLSSRAAEDLVVRTWQALLADHDGLAGTTSLKTRLVQCLRDEARAQGVRNHTHPGIPGTRVRAISGLLSQESRGWSAAEVRRAQAAAIIARLPADQREVIVLRDVERWTAAEVSAALGLRDEDQRALLHQARSEVRCALEPYLEPA